MRLFIRKLVTHGVVDMQACENWREKKKNSQRAALKCYYYYILKIFATSQ